MDRPQIICHVEKSLPFLLFDAHWIPCSEKIIVMGSKTRGTGVLQIYEINEKDAVLITAIEKYTEIKCGTFEASSLRDGYLATGDFLGKLQIWNLETMSVPIYSVNGHSNIIDAIDGVAGTTMGRGAPEIVTGSRDGSVKVWDPRQKNRPVAVMEPADGEPRQDCLAVAFGNSYNSEERIVCAGYNNGDIKMFDLKAMNIRWETNIKNGVCSLEFDRKDTYMNKLFATTLEPMLYVFDLRTQHPKKGFAKVKEKALKSTMSLSRVLPQNRDIFITCEGGGTVRLWKYNYPQYRYTKSEDGDNIGVAGTLSLLQNRVLSTQPISSFQWSSDKLGVGVCTSFDQKVRVVIATKLNLYG